MWPRIFFSKLYDHLLSHFAYRNRIKAECSVAIKKLHSCDVVVTPVMMSSFSMRKKFLLQSFSLFGVTWNPLIVYGTVGLKLIVYVYTNKEIKRRQ